MSFSVEMMASAGILNLFLSLLSREQHDLPDRSPRLRHGRLPQSEGFGRAELLDDDGAHSPPNYHAPHASPERTRGAPGFRVHSPWTGAEAGARLCTDETQMGVRDRELPPSPSRMPPGSKVLAHSPGLTHRAECVPLRLFGRIWARACGMNSASEKATWAPDGMHRRADGAKPAAAEAKGAPRAMGRALDEATGAFRVPVPPPSGGTGALREIRGSAGSGPSAG